MRFFRRSKSAAEAKDAGPDAEATEAGEKDARAEDVGTELEQGAEKSAAEQADAARLPVEAGDTPSDEAAVRREPGLDGRDAPPLPASAAPSTAAAADDAPTATTPAPAPRPQADGDAGRGGLFSRLRRGLGRTSDNLVAGLGSLFLGRKAIDDDLLEELESQLLMADVGIEATNDIIAKLTARVSRRELADPEALLSALRQELEEILTPCEQALDVSAASPFVLLVVGVNGVGKTTTIGKMARRFQSEGRSVMLAAGDTFRAAAVEQLQHWGERHSVPVIAQHQGADSASVIYDALQAATARGVDVLIADTAGRLSNKSHLMDELAKVVRVLRKLNPDAPHEVLLVLDAGTGQNALAQADQFREAVGVTGLALTKLDGTAKGGVIFAIARRLGLPIRFIGVGEAAEDLRPFAAADFIRALFDRA
ncbi:MAG: signal recognition particle-docking protein FtsY [Halieaceae bacterium]|jgi:fused signal recognition particle receptor|nr:signal recognition particle-docking protein FtsY [Halieaceae bacterium]